MSLSKSLKAAIDGSGCTCYEICKRSGVNKAAVSRFMSGERGLSMQSAEAIAEAMGLEIVLRPVRRAKATKAAKRGK